MLFFLRVCCDRVKHSVSCKVFVYYLSELILTFGEVLFVAAPRVNSLFRHGKVFPIPKLEHYRYAFMFFVAACSLASASK